jgi:hypothetical protein
MLVHRGRGPEGAARTVAAPGEHAGQDLTRPATHWRWLRRRLRGATALARQRVPCSRWVPLACPCGCLPSRPPFPSPPPATHPIWPPSHAVAARVHAVGTHWRWLRSRLRGATALARQRVPCSRWVPLACPCGCLPSRPPFPSVPPATHLIWPRTHTIAARVQAVGTHWRWLRSYSIGQPMVTERHAACSRWVPLACPCACVPSSPPSPSVQPASHLIWPPSHAVAARVHAVETHWPWLRSAAQEVVLWSS